MFSRKQTLFNEIRARISQQSSEEFSCVFHAMGLPEPLAKSYHLKSRFLDRAFKNAVVPIHDYGLVMRLDNKDMDLGIHPFILRPFSELNIDGLRMRLCQGVYSVGISQNDFDTMSQSLKESGYKIFADRREDCGYLGVSTREFPNGIPVVFDLRDVYSTNAAHAPHPLQGVVDDYYQGLAIAAERFDAVIGGASPTTFWEALRRLRANEDAPHYLTPSWMDTSTLTGKAFRQIQDASHSYSEQLRAQPMHHDAITAAF